MRRPLGSVSTNVPFSISQATRYLTEEIFWPVMTARWAACSRRCQKSTVARCMRRNCSLKCSISPSLYLSLSSKRRQAPRPPPKPKAKSLILPKPRPSSSSGVTVRLRKGEGFRPWGEEQIAAFRQCHALGTRARLALELLLNTAQRRSGTVRMGPQHIRNGLLHVRQQKTGEPLQLPIFPELQAAIDAMPNRDRHLTFLTTKSGRPFSPAGFTNWFRHVCNGAGLRGFTAHGLRKASMTRLAEAGCSVHEIAAFSGHKTLSEIAHYTRSVEQAALAREAMAKARTKLSKSVGLTVKNRKKANENKS